MEGSVRFLHHVPDREPTLLHVAEPGFWFGQLTVLERGRPVATAVSRTPTKALVLTRPAFTRLAAEDSRLEPAVRQIIDERLRLTHRFLAQALDLPADERLRARLTDLADIHRLEDRVVGPSVVLGLTQAELGDRPARPAAGQRSTSRATSPGARGA